MKYSLYLGSKGCASALIFVYVVRKIILTAVEEIILTGFTVRKGMFTKTDLWIPGEILALF